MTPKALFLAPLALGLAACATTPQAPADSLDAIADDYLLLQLTIGEKEDGYIDAYYGPEAVQQQAVADASGYTKRKAMEKMDQRKKERIDRQKQANLIKKNAAAAQAAAADVAATSTKHFPQPTSSSYG